MGHGPLSDETKAKISASLRGRSHPHRGHPISAETRAKISAALKGLTRGGRHRRHHGRRHYIPHPRLRHAGRHRHGGHHRRRRHVAHPRAHHPRHHRAHHPRAHHPRHHRAHHPRAHHSRHHGHHLSAHTKRRVLHRHHTATRHHRAHPHPRLAHHTARRHHTRHPGVHPPHRRLHKHLHKNVHHSTGALHRGGIHGRRAQHHARHPRGALLSSTTRHHFRGYLHTRTHHKITKVRVRKTKLVRAHRVFPRRVTRRRSKRFHL